MPPFPLLSSTNPNSHSTHTRRHRESYLSRPEIWQTLDRSQVLGETEETGYGHRGCVNALSWASDGRALLSGSDDKHICIWTPSTDIPPTPTTPHPLSLATTISTGHKANIFSAKYLPNTSSKDGIIVTCAGDGQVRVFDVGRLGVKDDGMGGIGGRRRGEVLDGTSGEGTRVFRCHSDRVKRISTEDNPHVFLTVSEDSTVRQHDLRTTHSCPTACPSPLLSLSSSLSLYTLSLSKPNPYLFTVAGTAPFAWLLDRRMVGRSMETEWGKGGGVSSATDGGGKVHCVRRFGLAPEENAEGVMRRKVRHVTAVEMSQHNAEDLIVSFSGHSVALFSIHDTPNTTSARTSHPNPLLPKNTRSRKRSRSDENGEKAEESSSDVARPAMITRASGSRKGKERAIEEDIPYQREMSPSGSGALFGQMAEDMMDLEREDDEQKAGTAIGPISPSEIDVEEDDDDADLPELPEEDTNGQGSSTSGLSPRVESMDSDDWDVNQDDYEDNAGQDEDEDDSEEDEIDEEEDREDNDEEEDEDDNDEVDEWAHENDGLYTEHTTTSDSFSDVDVVYQRRCFKGARNVETVKDVTFLGARSDKVCSGSDDGNFFVWDKMTGKLEGIWEGDGSVVNVVEQHPSLPLVACSGIDSTVKIFAPLPIPPPRSMQRINNAQRIIETNTSPSSQGRYIPAFSRLAMIEQYSRLLRQSGAEPIRVRVGDAGEDDETVTCATQ